MIASSAYCPGSALRPQATMPRANSSWWSRCGVAGAVLVELHLHQGGLGPPARQARDDPGRRVRLLEVIDRTLPQQLQRLLAGPVTLEVPGQRRAVVGGDQGGQVGDEVACAFDGRQALAQPLLQPALEPPPQRQQVGVPLPPLVDVGEPAVAELVQDPQRERLVGQVGGVGGALDGPVVRPCGKPLDEVARRGSGPAPRSTEPRGRGRGAMTSFSQVDSGDGHLPEWVGVRGRANAVREANERSNHLDGGMTT